MALRLWKYRTVEGGQRLKAEADVLLGLSLLEFGADWCSYCHAAQPALAGLHIA